MSLIVILAIIIVIVAFIVAFQAEDKRAKKARPTFRNQKKPMKLDPRYVGDCGFPNVRHEHEHIGSEDDGLVTGMLIGSMMNHSTDSIVMAAAACELDATCGSGGSGAGCDSGSFDSGSCGGGE